MDNLNALAPDCNHLGSDRHEIGDDVELPRDFAPVAFPIISRHFFGIEPFRPIGELPTGIITNVRSRRNLERVHRDGVRPIGELLDELAREYGLGTVIEQKLEIYASLSDDALDATGGRELPPLPLHEVGA